MMDHEPRPPVVHPVEHSSERLAEHSGEHVPAPPHDAAGEATARPGRLRLALAARARREDMLARRAERLARIRAEVDGARIRAEAVSGTGAPPQDAAALRIAAPVAAPTVSLAPSSRTSDAEADALERFLAGLAGTVESGPVPPQPSRLPPAIVPLARRMPDRLPDRPARAEGAEGLSRLPGAGPGLVGALIRAGVPDLAALAGLAPGDLAGRLGPIARLIDLDAWIAFARRETGTDLPAAG